MGAESNVTQAVTDAVPSELRWSRTCSRGTHTARIPNPSGMAHLNRVVIDADVANLVPTYLDRLQQVLQRMRVRLDAQAYEDISVHSRNLHGSGDAYGFAVVSTIGLAIQRAAKNRDAPAVAFWIAELEKYLSSVEWVVLDRETG